MIYYDSRKKIRFVPSNKLKLAKQDIIWLYSKKVRKPARALTWCSSMFNLTCIHIHFIVTMPSRNQLLQSLPSIPIHLSQRHQGLTSCLGFMVCSLIRKLCEQRTWIKLYRNKLRFVRSQRFVVIKLLWMRETKCEVIVVIKLLWLPHQLIR